MTDRRVVTALPGVSIVIASLNRPALLRDTVTELLGARSACLRELIIVDQSDAPNQALAALPEPRIIYKHVGFKNLPRARNVGIDAARADVVLFLDDDVCGLEQIVDAHAHAHATAGADIVTGPILDPGEELRPLDALVPAQRTALALGKAQEKNLDAEYVPLFAPGGNSSYRRTLLRRLGGFDENFIGSAVGEDAEMTHRAKAAGARIVY